MVSTSTNVLCEIRSPNCVLCDAVMFFRETIIDAVFVELNIGHEMPSA